MFCFFEGFSLIRIGGEVQTVEGVVAVVDEFLEGGGDDHGIDGTVEGTVFAVHEEGEEIGELAELQVRVAVDEEEGELARDRFPEFFLDTDIL